MLALQLTTLPLLRFGTSSKLFEDLSQLALDLRLLTVGPVVSCAVLRVGQFKPEPACGYGVVFRCPPLPGIALEATL
jgi:hypothetical protein